MEKKNLWIEKGVEKGTRDNRHAYRSEEKHKG